VAPRDDGEVQELREEVEELRRQLGEVQERVDFTERLLAQQKDASALPPGGRR
jgi:predicted RNase H-like nuclease (RuvC/YqgF family)